MFLTKVPVDKKKNPQSNFSSGKFLKQGCTKTDRWKKKCFTNSCIFFFRCFVSENKNRSRWSHVFDGCSII